MKRAEVYAARACSGVATARATLEPKPWDEVERAASSTTRACSDAVCDASSTRNWTTWDQPPQRESAGAMCIRTDGAGCASVAPAVQCGCTAPPTRI